MTAEIFGWKRLATGFNQLNLSNAIYLQYIVIYVV